MPPKKTKKPINGDEDIQVIQKILSANILECDGKS